MDTILIFDDGNGTFQFVIRPNQNWEMETEGNGKEKSVYCQWKLINELHSNSHKNKQTNIMGNCVK